MLLGQLCCRGRHASTGRAGAPERAPRDPLLVSVSGRDGRWSPRRQPRLPSGNTVARLLSEITDEIPVTGIDARDLLLLREPKPGCALEYEGEHPRSDNSGPDDHDQAEELPEDVDLGVLEGVVAFGQAEVSTLVRAPADEPTMITPYEPAPRKGG